MHTHRFHLPAALLLLVASAALGHADPTVLSQAPSDPSTQDFYTWASCADANGNPINTGYDNFSPSTSSYVTAVQWRGNYIAYPDVPNNNPVGPDTTAFTISFLADDNGSPGAVLATSTVNNADCNPQSLGTLGGFVYVGGGAQYTITYYSYRAVLPTPFAVAAGQKYWISIVSLDNSDTVAWGWYSSGGANDGSSLQDLHDGNPPVNLFVANVINNTIEKITPDGTGTVFAHTGVFNPGGLAFDATGNLYVANGQNDTIYKFTPDGAGTLFANTMDGPMGLAFDAAGNLYVADFTNGIIEKFTPDGAGTVFATNSKGLNAPAALAFSPTPPSSFFHGAAYLGSGAYYLDFPNGNYFGYYSVLSDPRYIYHFDLGYEYVFDAADGKAGVYLYDFKSDTFFYTSPSFPFPYLYDFTLDAVLYYYPDPSNPGHYNTDGYRFFYDFNTETIITK